MDPPMKQALHRAINKTLGIALIAILVPALAAPLLGVNLNKAVRLLIQLHTIQQTVQMQQKPYAAQPQENSRPQCRDTSCNKPDYI